MAIFFMMVFLAVMVFMNFRNFGVDEFDDYATSKSKFGFIAISLSVFSTWYVGASFTAWATLNVGSGFLGAYVIPYASMMVITIYLVGEKTFLWGKKYKINTQAELMGLRYNSKFLRVLMAVSAIIFMAPWLLLEWVTQGYLFSYASNGALSPFWGMLIGVAVVLIYVSTGGMRAVITANIFQGAFMFIIGTGLMFYLLYYFFGNFSEAMGLLNNEHPEVLTYPGPGSELPTAYWTSIIISSGFGAFMWPWAYNKLFAAESVRSIKQSTLLTPVFSLIFWGAAVFLGQAMHSMDFARTNPEESYLWIANEAGPLTLALMSTLIMAASIGTVSGIIQALSTAISNDIAQVINKRISNSQALKIARSSVIAMGIIALVFATIDLGALINIALLTYQGIIMLFPIVILGLYWRRANKEGAILALIISTSFSMYVEFVQPPLLTQYGWTGGIYGTIIGFVIMIIAGYMKPVEPHVEKLWTDIATANLEKEKKMKIAN